MSRTELVVFDWDGTLLDSAGRIVESVRAAIEHTGLERRTDEQIREVIGLGMAEAVEALYPHAPDDARRRMAASYRETFVRTIAERPAPLFPGTGAVLDELEAAGYLLAIATGKSRSGLERDLEHAGLARRFAATRTVDECASKPHPAMVRELAAEFALPAHAALVVGDTVFDIEMAHGAGATAVGVSWGVHPPRRLRAASPAHLIDDLAELHPWMAGRPAADTESRRP